MIRNETEYTKEEVLVLATNEGRADKECIKLQGELINKHWPKDEDKLTVLQMLKIGQGKIEDSYLQAFLCTMDCKGYLSLPLIAYPSTIETYITGDISKQTQEALDVSYETIRRMNKRLDELYYRNKALEEKS